MKIKLLVTGGTFDKEYREIEGDLAFRETHVKEMLDRGRASVDFEIRTLMLMDSLDMTPEDRHIVAEQCKKSPEDHIVVTHGTDTMEETAKLVDSQVKDKVVVFTGAMIPYAFGSSDGMFNLGSALSFVQILEPGVYIAMNGRYFLASNVRKNPKTGLFETRSS